jgi:hypothetical protein
MRREKTKDRRTAPTHRGTLGARRKEPANHVADLRMPCNDRLFEIVTQQIEPLSPFPRRSNGSH